MASKPSGLRPPTSVKTSNTNIAKASGGGGGGSDGGGASEGQSSAVPATPAPGGGKGGSTALPTPMSRLPSSSSIRRKIATPAGMSNPPGSRDSGLVTDVDNFVIGDVVYVNGDATKRGKICFIGAVEFAKGEFAGIVLDLPIGNHDGVVQGKRYFQCAPLHGLFTKLSRLTRDPVQDSPSTPKAPQSVSSSVVMSPERRISSGVSGVNERTPSPGAASVAQSVTPRNSNLNVGERVIVASATGGTKIGILRYLGSTDFAPGDWAGVELLTPMGKNNGSVGGKSYFHCKEKHGLFVPSSKVISSPVNKTPRRHGSRESLVSVSSLASSAASRSIRRPIARESQCLPTCSLQSVLAEKENHIERLIKERELDRVDLANLSRQYEDKMLELRKVQAECNTYQQQLSTATGDSEEVARLQNLVDEERRKLEDLQYTLDEEKITKADLQAQLDSLQGKTSSDAAMTEAFQLEKQELTKEIKELKIKLEKQIQEGETKTAKLKEAQIEMDALSKTVSMLKHNICSMNDEVAQETTRNEIASLAKDQHIAVLEKALADEKEAILKIKEQEKSSLAQAEEIKNTLKKGLEEQKELALKLKDQLEDKKRREDEMKEKVQKLEVEFEATLKQKVALEAEVIDLVNSKTGTSEILTNKITDLSQEVQDLREKLQSMEEDKAVLRRINAEFKSRLAKQEESDAALKKTIEETEAKIVKVNEEKTKLEESEKNLNSRIAELETEKQVLESESLTKTEEIAWLNNKMFDFEKNAQHASASSHQQKALIKQLKLENADISTKLAESQQLLKQAEEEKAEHLLTSEKSTKELSSKISELNEEIKILTGRLSSTAAESEKKVTELSAKNNELTTEVKKLSAQNDGLTSEIQKLTSQLEISKNEITELKKEIENLKAEIVQAKAAVEEKAVKITSLEGEKKSLNEKLEDEINVSIELQSKYDALKKDKSALKEQLAAYKSEAKNFEEIESGLSQELLSLRNKLEQKTKAFADIEKELAEKKRAEAESTKVKELNAGDPQAHIDFLNSIIVDLQKKNEEQKIRLNVLLNGGGGDADANSNSVVSGESTVSAPGQQLRSLRSYCDICEKFDLHDTEDCPAQVSEENTHYGGTRGDSRPYCETCEIFGHVAGECDDQETF